VRDVYVLSYFCIHTSCAYVREYTCKIDCSKGIYFFLLNSVIYRDFNRAVEFLVANRTPIEKPLLIT
jgi:hypothetical protein